MDVLHAIRERIDRLRAREMMASATAVALGIGRLPQDAARDIWRDLERRADAGDRTAPRRVAPPSAAALAGLGIVAVGDPV